MILELSSYNTPAMAEAALRPVVLAVVFGVSLAVGLTRYFSWSILLYWYFYKRGATRPKLQAAPPNSGQVKREISWSLSSCLIYAAMAVGAYALAWQHKTRI